MTDTPNSIVAQVQANLKPKHDPLETMPLAQLHHVTATAEMALEEAVANTEVLDPHAEKALRSFVERGKARILAEESLKR